MRSKYRYVFLGIFLLASVLRVYGLQWDQGFHLHPDERAIIMFTEHVSPPQSLSQFLSVESPWNPKFFAYGSFPIYLLFFVGSFLSVFSPLYKTYDYLLFIGRFISAFADLGTLVMIFLLGRKLWNDKVGLLASFLYSISVLPLQLSHFYAVDTLLTLFVTTTLYLCIQFYLKPTFKKSLLIGVFLALSLTTKVSGMVLVVALGLVLSVDFVFVIAKRPHDFSHLRTHLPPFLRHLIFFGFTILGVATMLFILIEPYAIIDFPTFWQQTQQQAQMTKSAFTFPYTLQYVGKTPYLYEVKQIFFVGLGPVLSLLAFSGVIWWTYAILRKEKKNKWATEAILLVFFWVYVAIVGKFAIGFMRYLLPIYPVLALFAGSTLYFLLDRLFALTSRNVSRVVTGFLFILLLAWPLSFIQIYFRPHTRVVASNWIIEHIPEGKTLAVEHWDDALPFFGQDRYRMVTLPLYEKDTRQKWEHIERLLASADYIILASNRLYTPLMKLTDCLTLPPDYCYPQTAEYYRQLFAERRGFKKVAEFTSYPTIPLFSLPINDQGFDESFSVYDHPKVTIFEKIPSL